MRKPEEKRLLGRSRCKWEDNIKTRIGEIRLDLIVNIQSTKFTVIFLRYLRVYYITVSHTGFVWLRIGANISLL
jgi:hypothetical protein